MVKSALSRFWTLIDLSISVINFPPIIDFGDATSIGKFAGVLGLAMVEDLELSVRNDLVETDVSLFVLSFEL